MIQRCAWRSFKLSLWERYSWRLTLGIHICLHGLHASLRPLNTANTDRKIDNKRSERQRKVRDNGEAKEGRTQCLTRILYTRVTFIATQPCVNAVWNTKPDKTLMDDHLWRCPGTPSFPSQLSEWTQWLYWYGHQEQLRPKMKSSNPPRLNIMSGDRSPHLGHSRRSIVGALLCTAHIDFSFNLLGW